MLSSGQIDQLIKLRKELHQHPEAAGEEKDTASRIQSELEKTDPDEILTGIGGHGLVAIYNGNNPDAGPSLMIRAELDGLRIDEESDTEHRSKAENRMHACGHDGHMTIVMGVAKWLKENRPDKGKVLLLFQPAEETGEGAGWMLNDPVIKKMEIDRGIALHNLPGYKEGSVYIRNETFASASVGIKIKFRGKSSHAAFPEQGINPSGAISDLISKVEKIKQTESEKDYLRILTVTYIKVGEPAFGINPGQGEMGITLRAETDSLIQQLKEKLNASIKEVQNNFEGQITTEETEPFAATVNDRQGVEQLTKIAENTDINLKFLKEPFPWSEDFGRFRQKCPITLFGLGAGKDSFPLHSEKYDFNDSLIPAGVTLFCEWIKFNHYGS